jgi:hypothetical protein
MIIINMRANPKIFIEMVKCELRNGSQTRIIWIAPWEVFVDFDVEIRENGRIEFWTIVRVLTPDQT